jgi:transposase-like protein
MARTGRPSKYSAELVNEICERLATSNDGLAQICRQADMPAERTIYQWLEKHEDFRQSYARARERLADRWHAETVAIADTATDANLARLRVDARKWAASKLAPRKYGDRIVQEHVGKDGGPIQHEERQAVDIIEGMLNTVASRLPATDAPKPAPPDTKLH